VANKFSDAVFRAQLAAKPKLILLILAFRTNEKGVCWPSYRRIAKDAGCGESTAKEGVKLLIDEGLMSVAGKRQVRDTRLFTNVYQLDYEAITTLEKSGRLAYRGKSRTRCESDASRGGSHTPFGVASTPHSVRDPAELGVGTSSKLLNKNSSENSSLNSSETSTHLDVLYKTTGETPETPKGTTSHKPVNVHPREHLFNGADPECQSHDCTFSCEHSSRHVNSANDDYEICDVCGMSFDYFG